MVDLPESCKAVLNVLLDGPVTWRAPAEIAGALGRDESETLDLLCDLDVGGWVAVRDTDAGPTVALSPLGVQRLGVRIVESGPDATPRWARPGEPDPPPPRPKNVCRSDRAAALGFVDDPAPPPDVAAQGGERAEGLAAAAAGGGAAAARPDELPRPAVLVGLSLTPWPGPAPADAATCPACGGRTLRPQMYCLYCDRWGLDRLAFGVESSVPAAPGGPARRDRPGPEHDRLQADRLRARRKAKRRAHHQARTEAERRRGPGPAAGPGARPPGNPAPLPVPRTNPSKPTAPPTRTPVT